MPPARRRKSKRVTAQAAHVSDDDDDVFETATNQTKKSFRCYRTTKKVPIKKETDEKSNQTGKKHKMSSSSEVDRSPTVSIILHSDDSDYELDIEPRNGKNQKRTLDSDDDSDKSLESKRRKLEDDSNNTESNVANDNASVETPINDDSVQKENDSVDLETDLNNKNDDVESSDKKGEEKSLEEPKQCDGSVSEAEICVDDIDIHIDSEIEEIIETNENEDESVNETDVVPESNLKANEETERSPNTNVDESSIQLNENDENDKNDDDGAKNGENDSKNDNESDNDEDLSQGNPDEDFINLFEEDSIFTDDEDEESPNFSPIVPSAGQRQKKSIPMAIPKWKKADMEKGKTGELRQPEPRKPITSIPSTSRATVAQKSDILPTEPDKLVFKVPQRISQTPTQVRDPRLTRSVVQGNNIIRVVQNNVDVPAAVPNQQSQPQIVRRPVLCDVSESQRKSVKDRLGTRQNFINFNNSAATAPTQIIVPDIQSETSFVIPKSVPPLSTTLNNITASSSSSSMVDRLNKPIDSIPVQRQVPKESQPNVAAQMAGPQNAPPQPIPAFALNPVRKKEVKLTVPSFASGPQQYEPVFTYLFKKTCRYNMIDACKNEHECSLSHRLPDHDFFRKSLDKMFQKSVIDLYDNYMRRNIKLFRFYFMDFCTYFGRNNLTDKLLQMVHDCNERKVTFHYSDIIEGLILTGKSFTLALFDLIGAIQYRTKLISKEIVKLILSPRNESINSFVSALKSIAQQDNFSFSVEWMNRLLLIWHEKNVHELNETIWHLICKDQSLVAKLDSELVTKFMDAHGRS